MSRQKRSAHHCAPSEVKVLNEPLNSLGVGTLQNIAKASSVARDVISYPAERVNGRGRITNESRSLTARKAVKRLFVTKKSLVRERIRYYSRSLTARMTLYSQAG